MENRCPECGGTGFKIRSNPDGTTHALDCSCKDRDRSGRLLLSARIPRRYEHCTLEGFELHNRKLERARSIAAKWVERWPDIEEGQGLLFHGNPGAGKTHLAVGILRELACGKKARTLFYEQRELLKILQGTFETGAVRSESQVLGPIQQAEILVLDDVGAGRTTEWARDVLHEIITHRYNNRLSMIITTNCPIGDDSTPGHEEPDVLGKLTLRHRLGDALMSRLYEMCRFVTVEGGCKDNPEKDYRKGILKSQIDRF